MRQILSIYFLLLMLNCNLGSLQVFLCVSTGQGCGTETSMVCGSESTCVPAPFKDQGNKKKPDKNTPCCFVCSPNCCCYLVPTVDLPCWLFPEEFPEAPQGLQCWFAQSFQRDIWHPPAGEVA